MIVNSDESCFIISGVSGSIGGNLAQHLIGAGHHVIGVSRFCPKKALIEGHPKLTWLIYDSSKNEADNNVVDRLDKLLFRKKLLGVYLCAGLYSSGIPAGLSQQDYKLSIEGNLYTTINMVKLVLELVSPGGSIIVLNSQAAISASNAEIAYGLAKRAISSYIDGMQVEATKRGLQIVNVLCGAVQSCMTEERPDFNKFISLQDLSETLYSLSKVGPSLRLKDIEVLRRNY
jgi:NAD(P)-dependent dehydrogenase (short-subunit alcohol dehydrogenase family)